MSLDQKDLYYVAVKVFLRQTSRIHAPRTQRGESRQSHVESKWVDIKTFKPEKYFTGGWLKVVQEFLALRRSSAQRTR